MVLSSCGIDDQNGIPYALQVCPVHMKYWLQIHFKYTAVKLQTDMGVYKISDFTVRNCIPCQLESEWNWRTFAGIGIDFSRNCISLVFMVKKQIISNLPSHEICPHQTNSMNNLEHCGKVNPVLSTSIIQVSVIVQIAIYDLLSTS